MPLERANSKSSLLAELEALKARIEVEDAAEPSGEPPIVFVLDDTLACPTCHRQLPARRAEIHARACERLRIKPSAAQVAAAREADAIRARARARAAATADEGDDDAAEASTVEADDDEEAQRIAALMQFH